MTQARKVPFDGKIDPIADGARRVLFLGYAEAETRLIAELQRLGCEVWHAAEGLSSLDGYDAVVSFGYKHIIGPDVLAGAGGPVVNLHIGYLPYNRGAHPNFWSFFDGTPSGVTVHLIDEGVDTGDILFQRYVNFDKGERTFKQTYARLMQEAEDLFADNAAAVLRGTYTPRPQRGKGTYHAVKELPAEFAGWDSDVDEEIRRLDELGVRSVADKLSLIDEIEAVRQNNNVNWMDLLRLAFSAAPQQAKEIVRRINTDDNKISDLFKRLGN